MLWNGLESKSQSGTTYSYDVHEVGEANGEVTLGGRTYKVKKDDHAQTGHFITNELKAPTPKKPPMGTTEPRTTSSK